MSGAGLAADQINLIVLHATTGREIKIMVVSVNQLIILMGYRMAPAIHVLRDVSSALVHLLTNAMFVTPQLTKLT